MTIAGDYIGRVRLGVTIGVAGSQSFVWPDGIPAGTYTADAGADGLITLTATVDGDTLTVAWAAADSRRMIGHPWRVLRDGTWLFGDLYVIEAEPSDDDPTEYTVLDGTVEVTVAMVAPSGDASSDDVTVPDGTAPVVEAAYPPATQSLTDYLNSIDDGFGALGGSLVSVSSTVGEINTRLGTAEGDIDTLGTDVAALEAAAVASPAAAADHTRSETLARRQTDPLLALCTPWGGDHDHGAYTTDAPDTFTDGMWVRFTVTPLPMEGYTDPADGALVYSELFTQTAEGVGLWDIFEAAVERKYDLAAGVWRSYLFFEATETGGTEETISLSTSSVSSVGATSYPIWEMPEGVPTECAVWFDFVNGDGVWDLKLLRRTHYGAADVTADGAEWDVVSRAVGSAAGSIASSVYPWAIGMGNGAVLLNEVQVRDGGPAGSLLARPTAALAAAAGEGVAFTDGQGNEWTPGPDAAIFDPTDTGGGVPTSRTITAGTGLTGGGTLAADRTLAVSYGTTAGTSAQGNDSRFGVVVDATGDLTRLNNTLADDGELTFTGTSGTRYWIDAFVALSGDGTADAKVGVVIPGGTMCVMAEHPAANISTYPTTQQMTVLTASAATAQVGVLTGGTTVCRLSGWVDLTSTGTVALHWAQNNTGAGTGVTRLAKSRITYRS